MDIPTSPRSQPDARWITVELRPLHHRPGHYVVRGDALAWSGDGVEIHTNSFISIELDHEPTDDEYTTLATELVETLTRLIGWADRDDVDVQVNR